MAFEKGNKLGTGRPKGALNRSTEQAKLAIARLANSGLDALREDIEKIRKSRQSGQLVMQYKLYHCHRSNKNVNTER